MVATMYTSVISIHAHFSSYTQTLHLPKYLLGNRNAHTHKSPSILTLETQVLSLEMSSLGIFSNLFHSVCSPLALW